MKPMSRFSPKNKSLLFPLASGLILLGIIFAISFLSISQPSTPPPPETEEETETTSTFDPDMITTTPENVVVDRIVPSEPIPLIPGKPYTFRIYFKGPVRAEDLVFYLTYRPVWANKPRVVKKVQQTQSEANIISIKTVDPIEDHGEYELQIISTTTRKYVLTRTYLTKDVVPTPYPSNNPALKRFLPYNAPTYSLEYSPERNEYVFHLKYNPKSPLSTQKQFEAAQQEAIRFMQSKGINVNTIVIDWRYS